MEEEKKEKNNNLPNPEPSSPPPPPSPSPSQSQSQSPPPVTPPPSSSYTPSEEKLEFFKREEIKTMEKDLFLLREEEAKKERERIAGLKTEEIKKRVEEKKEERPVEERVQKIERKFLPPVFTQPIFSKLSSKEKIFIRVITIIVVVLLIFLVVTFGRWYSSEMEKISLPPQSQIVITSPTPTITPETIPQAEATPTPSPTPIFSIEEKLLNSGYVVPKNPRLIDTIIIHSTYNTSGDDVYDTEKVIQEFKKNRVASHYLVNREGKIYQLAPDKAIAYHAGKSIMPDGSRKNAINNFSIGIELIYKEEDSPNEIQYQALVWLVKTLKEKYNISNENILGHKDISTTDKTDPWNFDWSYFRSLLQ